MALCGLRKPPNLSATLPFATRLSSSTVRVSQAEDKLGLSEGFNQAWSDWVGVCQWEHVASFSTLCGWLWAAYCITAREHLEEQSQWKKNRSSGIKKHDGWVSQHSHGVTLISSKLLSGFGHAVKGFSDFSMCCRYCCPLWQLLMEMFMIVFTDRLTLNCHFRSIWLKRKHQT